MPDEPMAVLKWDFTSLFSGVRFKGEHTLRTRSEAENLRDKMNSLYGGGTHWVETLNHTKAERAAAIQSGDKDG